VIAWPGGARAFVERARVARLATADAAGVPHVVPICFALAADRLFSVVDQKPKRAPLALKRLRNVAENAHVAVIVDVWDEDWSKLRWVLLRGTAATVTGPAEYGAAIAALEAKYAQYRGAGFVPERNPVLRVDVERVTAWSAAGA
jgi:PPOX class probable F420-dependent enzyme